MVAAIAVFGGVAAAGASPATPSAGGAATQGSSSSIQVIQTPSGGGLPFCLPPALALRQSTSSTASTFRVRITVSTRLCAPLQAAAVVYAMPSTTVAWPQTLKERVNFTLLEAGVTDVIFTKACEPVQFDVLTGATPQVISPTGPYHGPLLFPFDLSTSLQYRGCVSPTTVPDGCDDYTPSDLAATPANASPGDTLTVTGTGTPNTSIQVILRPPGGGAPIFAEPAPVGDDGSWSTTVTIPADGVPGTWIVAAQAVTCETEVTTEVQVGQGGTSPTAAPFTEGPVVAGESVVNALPQSAVVDGAVLGSAADPGQALAAGASRGEAQASGLAFTGSATHVPVAVGIVLLTAGGLMLLGSRRRRSAA